MPGTGATAATGGWQLQAGRGGGFGCWQLQAGRGGGFGCGTAAGPAFTCKKKIFFQLLIFQQE